ncbi:MAG: hypothetical protein LC723_14925 [Actinobacteria bacterium]|nr:hypothetical protein [Actinomycetota bacterium]
MDQQEALQLDQAEQASLPGMAPARLDHSQPPPDHSQPPLMGLVSEVPSQWPPARVEVGINQMNLLADQSVLVAQEVQPQQLALLEDPPLWEQEPAPIQRKPSPGRLARKRARAGISAGQGTLF